MLVNSLSHDYHRFRMRIGLVGGILLFLAGCGQIVPSTEDSGRPSPLSTPLIAASPTQGVETEVTIPPSTPSNPGLQGLIERAKEDLAQRLSISVSQISLIEAAEVEWNDSSLGCPQPGMDYLQVITPGYRIVFEAGGNQYEYHSNRDTYFVSCDHTIPPISPNP